MDCIFLNHCYQQWLRIKNCLSKHKYFVNIKSDLFSIFLVKQHNTQKWPKNSYIFLILEPIGRFVLCKKCSPPNMATLTSRIRVHIWVFILRKLSTLCGLIWVYMIMNNSRFRPICILFKSIHLLQARKVKTKYAIPTGIMTFISYLSFCLHACLLLARGIPSFYTSLCIGHQNKIFVVKEIN